MNKEKEIDMLKEKLDYYTLVATDEEFDAEEVIKIVKRLEELEPTEAPENLSMNFGRFLEILRGTRKEGKILEEFRKQK